MILIFKTTKNTLGLLIERKTELWRKYDDITYDNIEHMILRDLPSGYAVDETHRGLSVSEYRAYKIDAPDVYYTYINTNFIKDEQLPLTVEILGFPKMIYNYINHCMNIVNLMAKRLYEIEDIPYFDKDTKTVEDLIDMYWTKALNEMTDVNAIKALDETLEIFKNSHSECFKLSKMIDAKFENGLVTKMKGDKDENSV